MSLESLRFMLGGAIHHGSSVEDAITVRHTEEVVCGANGVVPKPKDHLTDAEYRVVASVAAPVRVINLTTGVRTQLTEGEIDGTKVINFLNPEMGVNTAVATKQGDRLRIFWEETFNTDAQADAAVEVTISPETFPGTYRVIGDTFMRSQASGKDEAFQFVIGRAKVLSEVTLTLEARKPLGLFKFCELLEATA